jgi:hypothetical protein
VNGRSATKKLCCTFFLFCIGGALYNIIEVLWRGYTHWTMFIVGGMCFNIIGKIHSLCRKGMVIRCTLCALAITIIEFISGYLFNIRLKMNVWDYSSMLFNIKGQVCLLYSVLWGGLSVIALPVYRFCLSHLTSNKSNSKKQMLKGFAR